MARDHYEVLGLERGCSQSEVRAAYRRLVKLYHPDTSTVPDAIEAFHRITQAYEVLSDWERRGHYDRLLDLEEKRAVVQPKAQPAEARRPVYAGVGRSRRAAVVAEVARLTLLHSRGQSSQAERLAQKIIGYDPRQPVPYAVLGDLMRARGELKHAAKMYALAVQMDPGNELYQQRHEEMVSFAVVGVGREREQGRNVALLLGAGIVLLCALYLALAQEEALLPQLGPVSSWTLGVWVMAFLSGVAVGAAMCYAELLDRFFSVATTVLGRVSPVVALASIAIVNFWIAAAVYVLLGAAQRSFNYSTTRIVAATGGATFVLALAAGLSPMIQGAQVLAWGGNLVYIGALCGWMVADSMRR